jgi:hypothetical protein
MNKWYQELAKGQRIFIYLVAVIFPFLIGATVKVFVVMLVLYLPLATLIYLHLGSNKNE